MECLHCGGCCTVMSPKSAPFPCPDLLERAGYYFCRCYPWRPRICRDFEFPEFPFCPYGMNRLRLAYPEDEAQLKARAAAGQRLLQALLRRSDAA